MKRAVVTIALALAAASLTVATTATAAPGGGGKPSSSDASLPLVVVDASGKVVGRLAPTPNAPAVVLSVNGVLTSFPLRFAELGGFTDWERVTPSLDRLYFTTPNCTGTAYMGNGHGTRLVGRQAVAVRTADGRNWLYVAGTAAVVNMSFGSILETGSCTTLVGTVDGAPVNQALDLTSNFSEPYTVR